MCCDSSQSDVPGDESYTELGLMTSQMGLCPYVLEQTDAGAPGDEIVVSPETFRESDFELDIWQCDEVGIALLVSHSDVASGRDCVFIPRVTWIAASRERLVFGAGIGPSGSRRRRCVCDRCSPGGYIPFVREFHTEDGQ